MNKELTSKQFINKLRHDKKYDKKDIDNLKKDFESLSIISDINSDLSIMLNKIKLKLNVLITCLKLIKEKEIDLNELEYCKSDEQYNFGKNQIKKLTPEQFNFLKENLNEYLYKLF